MKSELTREQWLTIAELVSEKFLSLSVGCGVESEDDEAEVNVCRKELMGVLIAIDKANPHLREGGTTGIEVLKAELKEELNLRGVTV